MSPCSHALVVVVPDRCLSFTFAAVSFLERGKTLSSMKMTFIYDCGGVWGWGYGVRWC